MPMLPCCQCSREKQRWDLGEIWFCFGQVGQVQSWGGFTEVGWHSSSQETEKTALRYLSGNPRCFFSDSTKRREWGSKGPCGVGGATLLEEGQDFVGFTASEGSGRWKGTEWASLQKAGCLWPLSSNPFHFHSSYKHHKMLRVLDSSAPTLDREHFQIYREAENIQQPSLTHPLPQCANYILLNAFHTQSPTNPSYFWYIIYLLILFFTTAF